MTKIINGIAYDTKRMDLLHTRANSVAYNIMGSTTLLKDPVTGHFLIREHAWNRIDGETVVNDLRVTTPEHAKAILQQA